MIWFAFLKILSESLLSFYPAMVKYVKFPIINQLWSRLVVYCIVALFFLDWANLGKLLFSWIGLILAVVNVFHIYTSYIGFNYLESGVSYSLFYTYPIFILIFSGLWFQMFYLLPLIGVGFLTYSNWKDSVNLGRSKKKFAFGILGIIGAMLSEVGLYFIVKKIGGGKDMSKWNVLFVAYLLPAIILTAILGKKALPPKENVQGSEKGNKEWTKNLVIMIVGNAVIGALGYYLRFYTIDKMSVSLYSGLSYFGIVMAYVYGWTINKEKVGWYSIIGSILVIIGGLLVGKN